MTSYVSISQIQFGDGPHRKHGLPQFLCCCMRNCYCGQVTVTNRYVAEHSRSIGQSRVYRATAVSAVFTAQVSSGHTTVLVLSHVKWFSSHNVMARSRVPDGNSLHIRKITVIVLDNHSRTAEVDSPV
jgi:hypothetical protein